MITIWTEQQILLSVVGMVGLIATLVVYSRANRITDRYYKATRINQDLIKLNEEMFN